MTNMKLFWLFSLPDGQFIYVQSEGTNKVFEVFLGTATGMQELKIRQNQVAGREIVIETSKGTLRFGKDPAMWNNTELQGLNPNSYLIEQEGTEVHLSKRSLRKKHSTTR